MDTRKVKIGRITCGVLLVITGLLIFITMINKQFSLSATLSLWPVILISLGLETLYFSFKKDIETKFDFWCMVILVFITTLCLSCYTVNTYIVEVIGKDIKDAFIEDRRSHTEIWDLKDNEVSIENLSKIANVEIIESEMIDVPRIIVEVKYKDMFLKEIYKTYIRMDNGIIILDNDENLDSMNVKVYIKDTGLVKNVN